MCTVNSLEDLKDIKIVEDNDEILIADKSVYRKYTKEVAVVIGYMLGVKEEYLQIIYDSNPVDEIILKIKKCENATVIRHLNNIRSNLILDFKSVSRSIRLTSANYTPIYKLELFEEDFKALSRMEIHINTGRPDINEYIEIINDEISKRLASTKSLFPDWLEFKNIEVMFTMPRNNIEAESKKFQINQSYYPYKKYFNWYQPKECGNILLSDYKLLKIVYSSNGDYFDSNNKVMDASDNVKNNIQSFIKNGRKIQIFIDGENVDPYRFATAIDGLQNHEINKIDKIVVYYDSMFSSKAWEMLKHFSCDIDVEPIAVERIKEDKSLVDHKLVAGVSKACYKEDVDSIILASSDSDFYSVIEDVPANYLVMIEKEKCGPDFKDVLREHNIFYCYLDKFIAPEDDSFFKAVFKKELEKIIESKFNLPSAKCIFNRAIVETRAIIPEAESNNLFNRYIKNLSLKINSDGNFEIVIPE